MHSLRDSALARLAQSREGSTITGIGFVLGLAATAVIAMLPGPTRSGQAVAAGDSPASTQASAGDQASEEKSADQSVIDKIKDLPERDKDKSEHEPLKGYVKGTAIPTDEGLSRIGMASEFIQDGSERIMREATRKDTVVVRGPNVLPNGVVIPALGSPSGVINFGELPMRKKKLDAWIANMDQNITAMQNCVDGLILPQDKLAIIDDAWTSLRKTLLDAQGHMSTLKELASAKRLVNLKIGKEAVRIYDDMQAIEKARGQIVASLSASQSESTKPQEGESK